MHVLFITSWFETPSRPTAGKAVKDLAIALHRQFISVSILFQSFERLPWQSKSGVIDVFHFRSVSRTKFYPVFNIGPLKKGIHHFQEYVNKKGKPDLIHIHSYSSLALGHEIYRLFKIPILYTEHSSQVVTTRAMVAGWTGSGVAEGESGVGDAAATVTSFSLFPPG